MCPHKPFDTVTKELHVETLLDGPLATLPLAPIADVRTEELPGVIARMQARVTAETPTTDVELWKDALSPTPENRQSTIPDRHTTQHQSIARVP